MDDRKMINNLGYGIPPVVPRRSHEEIRESLLIGNLKNFLYFHKDEIREGAYVGLNGTAKSFYAQGWELYERILREGYSFYGNLTDTERETLMIFTTQAKEEYLNYANKKYRKKIVDILANLTNSLESEVKSGKTLKSILENHKS